MGYAKAINSNDYVSNLKIKPGRAFITEKTNFKENSLSLISVNSPVVEVESNLSSNKKEFKNLITTSHMKKDGYSTMFVGESKKTHDAKLEDLDRKHFTVKSIERANLPKDIASTTIFINEDVFNHINVSEAATQVSEDSNFVSYEEFGAVSMVIANDKAYKESSNEKAYVDMYDFNLTIQLMSFMEYHFDFNSKRVEYISGLPNGVDFNSQYQKLYGSPLVAGIYVITIMFTDNTSLVGRIKVPKVKRDI